MRVEAGRDPGLLSFRKQGPDMTQGKTIRPKRETAESKAETTKRVSQELSRAETEERDAKTAKLRAARLAHEETLLEQANGKRRS